MLRITPDIAIDDSQLELSFVHSSGPGGQNVNKVATAVQLRFDAMSCPDLPDDLKRRLPSIAGSLMTSQGVILIDARRHRSQARNRQDALERLVELLAQAAVRPKRRRPTRPTAGSRQRRLASKKKRSEVKSLRRRLTE